MFGAGAFVDGAERNDLALQALLNAWVAAPMNTAAEFLAAVNALRPLFLPASMPPPNGNGNDGEADVLVGNVGGLDYLI